MKKPMGKLAKTITQITTDLFYESKRRNDSKLKRKPSVFVKVQKLTDEDIATLMHPKMLKELLEFSKISQLNSSNEIINEDVTRNKINLGKLYKKIKATSGTFNKENDSINISSKLWETKRKNSIDETEIPSPKRSKKDNQEEELNAINSVVSSSKNQSIPKHANVISSQQRIQKEKTSIVEINQAKESPQLQSDKVKPNNSANLIQEKTLLDSDIVDKVQSKIPGDVTSISVPVPLVPANEIPVHKNNLLPTVLKEDNLTCKSVDISVQTDLSSSLLIDNHSQECSQIVGSRNIDAASAFKSAEQCGILEREIGSVASKLRHYKLSLEEEQTNEILKLRMKYSAREREIKNLVEDYEDILFKIKNIQELKKETPEKDAVEKSDMREAIINAIHKTNLQMNVPSISLKVEHKGTIKKSSSFTLSSAPKVTETNTDASLEKLISHSDKLSCEVSLPNKATLSISKVSTSIPQNSAAARENLRGGVAPDITIRPVQQPEVKLSKFRKSAFPTKNQSLLPKSVVATESNLSSSSSPKEAMPNQSAPSVYTSVSTRVAQSQAPVYHNVLASSHNYSNGRPLFLPKSFVPKEMDLNKPQELLPSSSHLSMTSTPNPLMPNLGPGLLIYRPQINISHNSKKQPEIKEGTTKSIQPSVTQTSVEFLGQQTSNQQKSVGGLRVVNVEGMLQKQVQTLTRNELIDQFSILKPREMQHQMQMAQNLNLQKSQQERNQNLKQQTSQPKINPISKPQTIIQWDTKNLQNKKETERSQNLKMKTNNVTSPHTLYHTIEVTDVISTPFQSTTISHSGTKNGSSKVKSSNTPILYNTLKKQHKQGPKSLPASSVPTNNTAEKNHCFMCGLEATVHCCGSYYYCSPDHQKKDRVHYELHMRKSK